MFDFLKMSLPAENKVPADKVERTYKRQRMQTFITATLGYALYYVCRLSMGVMKQPLIDAGLLNATQLGLIGACLYWAYAIGKLINGFLADSSNIKRFMALSGAVGLGNRQESCHGGKLRAGRRRHRAVLQPAQRGIYSFRCGQRQAIRRAGLSVAYSKGFSPHQLMSFAAPSTICAV